MALLELPHVFISYNRKDREVMAQIFDYLSKAGLAVWVDKDMFTGSNNWSWTVETAIKSAGCAVVLCSTNAKSSEWVQKEIILCQNHGITIFPVLINGDKKTSIPIEIINLQRAADLREANNFQDGMKALVNEIYLHLNAIK